MTDSTTTEIPQKISVLEQAKSIARELPRWIFIVALTAILVFAAFFVYHGYIFLSDFNDAVAILSDRYGINLWLSKAVALILVGPLAWGLKKSFFGKQATYYRVGTSAYACLYFLGMYFLSQNASFARSTGEVLQWYAETPEGVRYYDAPGFDTKYGLELKPVTSAFRVSHARREFGQTPNRIAIESVSSLELFDPLTGLAKYWFSQSQDGQYSLYDQRGFDPQLQVPLREVTPEVARKIVAALDAVKQVSVERELRTRQQAAKEADIRRVAEAKSLFTCNGTKPAAIAIRPEGGQSSRIAAGAIIQKLGVGAPSSGLDTEFFQPNFLAGGNFDRAFSGNTSFLREAGAFDCAKTITLSKVSAQCEKTILDVISCDVQMSYHALNSNGGISISGTESGRGAGISEQEALENAAQNVAKNVVPKLTKS